MTFEEGIGDQQMLKDAIDSAPPSTGRSNLDKGLEEAQKLFDDRNGVRREAKDVLVIVTDKRSTGDNRNAKEVAMNLAKDGVKIITVAIGSGPDFSNLKIVTPIKDNILNATKESDSPTKIAEAIMGKAKQTGK